MKLSTKISLFLATSGLFLLSTTPALAHNELIETAPAGGETVQAGLIPITLSFSEEPLDLGFGEGNLIAIADAATGEQLGAACAEIVGTELTTTVDIAKAGQYKILYKTASDDGHIATGDFLITVVNDTNYQTETPGNLCVDANGTVIRPADQEPLSVKQSSVGALEGLFIGIGFIVLGSVVSAVLITRKQKREDYKRYE
jgi:methionine-rich copper-binding protein CopC